MVAAGARTASPQRMEQYRVEREAILKAAYASIGKDGKPASVHDILEKAGLSTRAFYRHFKSKDALVLTMYRTAAERVNEELRRAVAEADDPSESLRAWISQQLAVAYDPRRAKQVSVLSSAEARAAAGIAEAEKEASEARRQILADVIAEGRRNGHFPGSENPAEDARAVAGATSALITARMAGLATPEWAEATEHLTSLFLRALEAAAK